jgi:hypothetical protein
MNKHAQEPNPWDAAKSIPVIRGHYDLEPGVKFFVLMLEQLGAVTEFSCEGHPHGFYITFHAPYELAWRLERCGYFLVEVMKTYGCWRLSLDRQQELESEKDKAQILRWAAAAWHRDIGKLQVLHTHGKRKTASART